MREEDCLDSESPIKERKNECHLEDKPTGGGAGFDQKSPNGED